VVNWAGARFGLLRLAAGILLFCLVCRIAAVQAFYALKPDFDNPTINPLKDNLFGRLDDFLIGNALRTLWERGVRPGAALTAAACAPERRCCEIASPRGAGRPDREWV